MTPAERGRLFQLKLRHNHEARLDAHRTLRQLPDGRWQARIGGRLRGRTLVVLTRALAVAAVEAHYNDVAERYNRELEARCVGNG